MTDQTATTHTARKRKASPLAVTIVIVVALIFGFIAASSVLSEVLWYRQLGYLPVLTTQWIAAATMFVIGFFGMAIPVFFAIDIAYRTRPVYARLTAQLDRYQEMLEPLRRVVKWMVPVIIGLFAGFQASTQWQRALLWINSEPTSTSDAQFHLDLSFYLFDLPLFQLVAAFASAVVLVSLIVGVATSYLYGGIALSGRDVRISKATRIQAAILATVYLLLQGVSFWLDQYASLTSNSGLLTGAMFRDVHAVIPGKQILAGIAVLVAVLFFTTSLTGKWRLPVIGTALLIISSLVLGTGYPWAVQQFQVQPDEKSLESDYIDRNIAATRTAYGIDDVQVERYDAVTDAESGALRNDAVATANIRIMDPEVISRTFAQLEQSKQYYTFVNPLSVDRYNIDGQVEDTVSGIREINTADQEGWYNRTLVYTHGYGLVAAYGNQRSPGGEPVFLENGIPTSGKLGKFEPRVYFGMNSPTYSIVGGKRDKHIEVDFPADAESNAEASAADEDRQEPANGESAQSLTGQEKRDASPAGPTRQNLTTFSGNGGPQLGNVLTKLIYAMKFQDVEILLSGAVVDGSQIIYDRNPVDRVKKVAPYLTIDSSPYASVVDGRVVWTVDGYTTSDSYPYSELMDMNELTVDADNERVSVLPNHINYIRNSVKATVDAYDGSVTLYAWDTEDPILKAWSKIFPNTLKSVADMSGDQLSHVRYPTDMFKVQREVLSTYHVTDSGAFYSQEDAWRTPANPARRTADAQAEAAAQPPYYLTLAAGKDAQPNFSIYSTYIPNARGKSARDILTGYLAANSNAGSEDGKISEDYGTLKLLTLPKSNTIPGPGQVQNSFNTDPKVSVELNLLRQGETRVISGNLLTLPVGGGLLYVQPVYVEASSGTSYPLLQRVLVSFGDDIAFEDTLDGALDVLFGGNSGASAGDGDTGGEQASGTTSPGNTGASQREKAAVEGGSSLRNDLLHEMKSALTERDQAMKQGDWSAYGKADERLRKAIEAVIAEED